MSEENIDKEIYDAEHAMARKIATLGAELAEANSNWRIANDNKFAAIKSMNAAIARAEKCEKLLAATMTDNFREHVFRIEERLERAEAYHLDAEIKLRDAEIENIRLKNELKRFGESQSEDWKELAAKDALISEMGEILEEVLNRRKKWDGLNGAELASWYRDAIDKVLARLSASEPAPEPSAESKYCFDCGFCGRFSEPGKCPSCGLSRNIFSAPSALGLYEDEIERYRKALESIQTRTMDSAIEKLCAEALAPDGIAGVEKP